VHFVGLFLSSLLKMHGPKNKKEYVNPDRVKEKVKQSARWTSTADGHN